MAKSLNTVINEKPIAEIRKETLNSAKSLTLEEIVTEMETLACKSPSSISESMVNETKLNMLEKVFNSKLKLKQLAEENAQPKDTKPIQLQIISNTPEQTNRVERIDQEIVNNYGIREDA